MPERKRFFPVDVFPKYTQLIKAFLVRSARSSSARPSTCRGRGAVQGSRCKPWFFVSGAFLVLIFGFLYWRIEAIIFSISQYLFWQQPSTFRSLVPLAMFCFLFFVLWFWVLIAWFVFFSKYFWQAKKEVQCRRWSWYGRPPSRAWEACDEA